MRSAGTERSTVGSTERRTDSCSPAGSQPTANASTGSGMPFSSSIPADSNSNPSCRPAIICAIGETRIPSLGALSHNRAASIDGIPK